MQPLLEKYDIKELTALRHKFTSDQLPVINSLLPELAKEVFKTSYDNGFWDLGKENQLTNPTYIRDIDEAKLLIISEIIEYVEASRSKNDSSIVTSILFDYLTNKNLTEGLRKVYIENHIKGTKEEEIADSVIRIMDLFTGVFPDRAFTIPAMQQETNEIFIDFTSSSMLLYIIGSFCSHKEGFDLEVTLKQAASLLIFGLDCNPIDILLIMFIKNEYNKTRGFKHGKTF